MSFFPSDPETEMTLISLIEEMIMQQKITNAHLEIVSDTEISVEDVECE